MFNWMKVLCIIFFFYIYSNPSVFARVRFLEIVAHTEVNNLMEKRVKYIGNQDHNFCLTIFTYK